MKTRTMRRTLPFLLVLCLILTGSVTIFADEEQTNPNDFDIIRSVMAEIDVEYGHQIVLQASRMGTGPLGFKTAGSRGEKQVANFIESEMRKLGLSNVRQDSVPVDAWDFGLATLEIRAEGVEQKTVNLSSYGGAPGTPVAGITAEIVYVGAGTLADYEDVDVTGKIVLAEFDLDNDYWFSMPVYQAERKGALAYVFANDGPTYGVPDDRLNSFDSQVRDTIPLVNISRGDARYIKELLEDGAVEVTLRSDAKIDKNGKSANVIGEIPGKMDDQYILLSAHYDGYFFAYQDDLLGVGVFMSVAKALLDAGYEPEHTLVFIAFGAEEYGVVDSHYDWITGSWYQVHHNTPEWMGNTTIGLNFDTQRPDNTVYRFAATPEYNRYFERFALTLNLPDHWSDGYMILGTNGPWSDDYNFISNGIPAVMPGGGRTPWRAHDYHTDADDERVYNPVTFKANAEIFTAMTVTFDRLLLPPFSNDIVMEEAIDTLDRDLIARAGLSDSALIAAANRYAADSDFYSEIQQVNALLKRISNAAALGAVEMEALDVFRGEVMKNRATILNAYKVIQNELLKLNAWDEVLYGHEVVQVNLAAVMDAKDALEDGDADAALEALETAESGDALPLFEKEVYEYWGVEAMNPERNDLYWGQGKVFPVMNLFDVYHAIADKAAEGVSDFTAEIRTIDGFVTAQTNTMRQLLSDETAIINKARGITDQLTLDEVLEMGGLILDEALEKLAEEGVLYSDVGPNFWAYDTINGMMLEGILSAGDTFEPNGETNRGEVAEWLAKAFNLPVEAALPAFTDVSANHPYAPYIAAVCKAGLMQGMGDGTFGANASLTRAQMATIAANVLEIEASTASASSFSDVPINSWYGRTVESVCEAGIMIGMGDDVFAPNSNLSKAQAITIMERLMYTK